jgi:hypothetical protein
MAATTGLLLVLMFDEGMPCPPEVGIAAAFWGAAERLAPQLEQKVAPSAFCAPHFVQNTGLGVFVSI